MPTLHIADLDGAYRLGRDAIVTESRTFGAEWTDAVYGDSRLCNNAVDVLELMRKQSEDFAVVPMGDSITTAGEGIDRTRVNSYLVIIAQRSADKAAEDTFFDRVERWENRWGGRAAFTYAVDGVAVEWLVSIEEAEPLIVEHNESGETIAHATTRRINLEVQACAS